MAGNLKKAQGVLLAYCGAVVLITLIHQPWVLLAGLVVAVAASGRRAPALLRRSLRAILLFNLTVSLGYLLLASLQGEVRWAYLVLVNVRVLLLVFLGFWLISTLDLLAALAGFPLLRLIASLALGQIKTFERILRDFRLAFESRNLVVPTWRDRVRHAAAQNQTLLDKSMALAAESAQAMRSRGCFDD